MVTIPKRCVQVWIGDVANIPETYATSLASIDKHLVANGWSYQLLTADIIDPFIQTNYPEFWPIYQGFEHAIQKADAVRPLWLNTYGGLYMDMHFEVLAPLDPLFTCNAEAFFVRSPNVNNLLTNALMASKPGATVWRFYIEEMQKPAPWYAFGKHLQVMETTGPMALSRAVEKSNTVYAALPRGLVVPCNLCAQTTECPATNNLLRQLPGGTWHDWDSRFFNFMYCHRLQVIFIGAAVIAGLVFLKYYKSTIAVLVVLLALGVLTIC